MRYIVVLYTREYPRWTQIGYISIDLLPPWYILLCLLACSALLALQVAWADTVIWLRTAVFYQMLPMPGKSEVALAFRFQGHKTSFVSALSKRFSIVGSLCDREVAYSASSSALDRQGSNYKKIVRRAVSSYTSHHAQEVFQAQVRGLVKLKKKKNPRKNRISQITPTHPIIQFFIFF